MKIKQQNGSSTTEQSRGASATAMWAGRDRIRNRSFRFPPSHSFSAVPESLRLLHCLSFQAGSAAMFKSRSLSSKDFGTVNISTLNLDSLNRAGVQCGEPHWGSGPAHTCRDRWFLMPRSPARIRVRQKRKALPWWAISDFARCTLWVPPWQPEESLYPEAEKEAVLGPASHGQQELYRQRARFPQIQISQAPLTSQLCSFTLREGVVHCISDVRF